MKYKNFIAFLLAFLMLVTNFTNVFASVSVNSNTGKTTTTSSSSHVTTNGGSSTVTVNGNSSTVTVNGNSNGSPTSSTESSTANSTSSPNVTISGSSNSSVTTTPQQVASPLKTIPQVTTPSAFSLSYSIAYSSVAGQTYKIQSDGTVGADASVKFKENAGDAGKDKSQSAIADWISNANGDKSTIAYCTSPFYSGTDNGTSTPVSTTVKVIDPSTYDSVDKVLLAIMNAGYPNNSYGLSRTQANYATLIAMQHWEFQHPSKYKSRLDMSFADDNWNRWYPDPSASASQKAVIQKTIDAAKQIYNTGVTNPYDPNSSNSSGVTTATNPVDNTMPLPINTADTAHYNIDITEKSTSPYTYGKITFNNPTLVKMLQQGTARVLINGSSVQYATGILNTSDTIQGFKIPYGAVATLQLDQTPAENAVPTAGQYVTSNYTFTTVGGSIMTSFLTQNTTQNVQNYAVTVPASASANSTVQWTKNQVQIPKIQIPSGGNGGLKITKYDNVTNQLVAGAIFKIRGISSNVSDFNIQLKASSDGTQPLTNGATATLEDGAITLSNIIPGTYEITEITPPPKYSLAIGQNSQTVEVKSETDVTMFPLVSFRNNPFGELDIEKIDSVTGSPVDGVVLHISSKDTGFEQDITTMNGGKAVVYDIPEGNYAITEISAPSNYVLSTDTVTASVKWGQTTTATFKNTPKTALQVTKIDADTNAYLGGATFRLTNPSTGDTWDATTFTDGIANFSNLVAGTYTVQEIQAPVGYTIDPTIQTIVIAENKMNTFTFKDHKKSTMIIVKKDKDTCQPIPCPCTVFTIEKMEEPNKGFITGSPFNTDNTGTLTVPNLDSGTYRVVETQPPTGYALPTDNEHIITITTGQDYSFDVFDQKLPTLEILKEDADTKLPLKGATFKVEKIDNPNAGIITGSPYTTDSNGKIDITGLVAGDYKITEISAPTGYNVEDLNYQIVTLLDGKDYTATFDDVRMPTITITKVDSQAGTALQGAEFKVEKMYDPNKGILEGSPYTTDSKGQIIIPSLGNGAYQITEVKAPDGYAIPTNPVTNVTVSNGKDVSVKINNEKVPSLTILKRDKDTQLPLKGGVFSIEKLDNPNKGVLPQSPYTTDHIGQIVLPQLSSGQYKITEITAPSGYNIDDPNYKIVELDNTKDSTVTFDDTRMPTFTIQKIDSNTGDQLQGAVFTVEKLQDPNKGMLTGNPFTTDDKGQINISNLASGTYQVVEISPPIGYVLPSPNSQIVTITANQDFTLKVENTKLPTLVVTKISGLSGKGVPNTYFDIEYTGNNDGGKVTNLGTYKTDKNGQIVIPNSQVGWYKITETIPAQGYSLPSNPVSMIYLSAGENAYSDLTPTIPDTSKGNTNVVVNGGGAYAPSPSVAFVGTDTASLSPITGVTPSDTPSPSLIPIITPSDTPSTSPNTIVANSSNVKEVSGNTFITSSMKSQATDPTTGLLNLQDLPIINYPLNSIVIKKTDAITGDLLAGATFELIEVSGQISGSNGTTIGQYTTDNSGIIVITGLEPATYLVKEVQAPTGYSLNVNAEQNCTLKEDGTSICELTFANYPYSSIVVKKVDSKTNAPLSGATFHVATGAGTNTGTSDGMFVTDSTGIFTVTGLPQGSYVITEMQPPTGYVLDGTPQTIYINQDGKAYSVLFQDNPVAGLIINKVDVNTGKPLANATFSVATGDGTAVGTSGGIFTTDSTGSFTVPNLKAGTFIVKETVAPPNYVLDSTPQSITIANDGRAYSLTFKDSPVGSLIITKYDSATKQPLSGAVFSVTDSKGNTIKDSPYTTDSTGTIQIFGLPEDTYVVTEIKAPNLYNIDTVPKTVYLYSGESKTLSFYDTPLGGLVVKKYDAITKEPLAETEFLVTNEKGSPVGTSDGMYRTDATGTFQISNLQIGSYAIKEVEAPDGYTLDNTVQTVYIHDNKIYTLEFFDNPLQDLTIEKLDGDSKAPLAGAIFKVTKADGTVIGQYTTDASGIVNVHKLDTGAYQIQEIKAPTGYILDGTVKLVNIVQGKGQQVEVYDYKIGGIQILKQDAKTGKPLSNAGFEVRKVDGTLIGSSYRSDVNGIVNIPNLDTGWYTVKETVAPDGYAIDDTLQNVQVGSSKLTQIIFKDNKMGTIRLTKTDFVTGAVVPDCVFKITNANGKLLGTDGLYTTDRNGRINLENQVEPATYTIQEVKVPDGYALDEAIKTVQVDYGSEVYVEWKNYPLASLEIDKNDDFTNLP